VAIPASSYDVEVVAPAACGLPVLLETCALLCCGLRSAMADTAQVAISVSLPPNGPAVDVDIRVSAKTGTTDGCARREHRTVTPDHPGSEPVSAESEQSTEDNR